jgi:GNAT superfamily N-acetyltransferase
MTPEISPLDPADDAALAAWHHVYLVSARHELGEVATPWQLEEVRAMLQDTGSRARSLGWSAVLDGETVGAGWLRTPLLDNLELAELDVHVLPSARRRGVGSALLARLESEAAARGRRVMTALASWPHDAGSAGTGASGPEFARAVGFELALSEVQRELALPVEDRVLAGLADDAARAHGASTLRSWTGPVPDDLLDGWARLTSTLVTEAPTGDLEVEQEAASADAVREQEAMLERQGRTKYNTVALSADGDLVAYSDLATTIHEPGRAYQWGTLVHPAHRGHRLGVAVKVANLRLLQTERPDIARVTTYNAEVNHHMVGVNEAMGFRPVARLGDFQKKLG